jgi:hypothetical protein
MAVLRCMVFAAVARDDVLALAAAVLERVPTGWVDATFERAAAKEGEVAEVLPTRGGVAVMRWPVVAAVLWDEVVVPAVALAAGTRMTRRALT